MKSLFKIAGLTLVAASLFVGGAFAGSAASTANQNTSDQLMPNTATQYYNMVNVLKKDQVVSKQIYENPSTGYSWVIEVKGDKGVISYTFDAPKVVADDKANKSSTGTSDQALICGQGTYKQLDIKGLKPGKATVQMKLVRPWEKNTPAIETMSFDIVVK